MPTRVNGSHIGVASGGNMHRIAERRNGQGISLPIRGGSYSLGLPGGGGIVISRVVTLPSLERGGVISASLPTTRIASFDVSMYLLATRETSAEVTFSMPSLYFSRKSAG